MNQFLKNQQSVREELNLLHLAEVQDRQESYEIELAEKVAMAHSETNNDLQVFLTHSDECYDYKDVSLLFERFLERACAAVGLVLHIISDAYSCPRNPVYKYTMR